MAEEFVEDIIAGADAGEIDASTDKSLLADTDVSADIVGAAKADADDAAEVVKDNSSSTADDLPAKKAVNASDSDGDSVAPGNPSEVEELASQLGWNKAHKGAEAVDAATYILRSKDIQKTMKDHNKDLKNQLNGLQGSVEALKSHNERVYKTDVKKLQSELTKLKVNKKAAVELADVAKVEELDQQIEEVQKDINAPVEKDTDVANPEYAEWVADNEWYLTDNEMAKYADTVADQYAGAPLDRIYALVRQKVVEVFPDKFADEKTSAGPVADATKDDGVVVNKVVGPKSPVEQGSRTDASASFTKADLSPAQLTIMNQFVKGGIMTEDQYVADIAKMQEA